MLNKLFRCFTLSIVIIGSSCCSKKQLTSAIDTSDKEPLGAPKQSWKEHWFSHSEELTRMYYDEDVAIYYDAKVDRSVNWPFKYIGEVWRYTKKTYGGHGPDSRLYAVLHTDPTGVLSGGHPDYWYNADHDYHNTIDCGPGPWLDKAQSIDMLTHEVFHIVESTSFSTRASVGYGIPPDGIWGDSKLSEIYQYDVYLGLGLEQEAERWKTHAMALSDNFPRSGSYWFRDWLFPVYQNYGKTRTLTEFFRLLSEYFPQDDKGAYQRKLNWGEYIHFSSGAAHADLQQLATKAFGWNSVWAAQLKKARVDFPKVTYKLDNP